VRSGGLAASFVSQTRKRDGRQFESQPTEPRRYGNPQRPPRTLNQAVMAWFPLAAGRSVHEFFSGRAPMRPLPEYDARCVVFGLPEVIA